nr:putative integron gene cassette protein [uncultured bacterium]
MPLSSNVRPVDVTVPQVDFARLNRAFAAAAVAALAIGAKIKLGIPSKFEKFQGVGSWQDVSDASPVIAVVSLAAGLVCWLFWPSKR